MMSRKMIENLGGKCYGDTFYNDSSHYERNLNKIKKYRSKRKFDAATSLLQKMLDFEQNKPQEYQDLYRIMDLKMWLDIIEKVRLFDENW